MRECRLLTSFTIMLTVCMHEPSIINRDAFVYLSLAVEMLRVCECVHACVYVCAPTILHTILGVNSSGNLNQVGVQAHPKMTFNS